MKRSTIAGVGVEEDMQLRKGDKTNFQTLLKAAQSGDLALLSARRKSDVAKVALICAMGRREEEGETFYYPAPLAVMVEGNPYELFEDPTI